ncbi:hypothetical protein [Campylobacter sp. 19-13652]|uniref:hypothetical protein n=1 Tax=Campylobacter sp. 19-13652 TaxID=2840180 RepID=UPI001C74FEBA|nr:hypothetical protein [Campylobacter sp. 19-13652]BCX79278.1 hypothetical protein LBC_07400 [Campylobacter sp. 19-13652]
MASSVFITILKDPALKKLDELIQKSPNWANEALGKVGAAVRKNIATKTRSYGELNTGVGNKNGRVLLSSQDDGDKKIAFSRLSHKNNKSQPDMGELARFRVYDANHKLLVGFFDTKSFTPTLYRNGEIVGKGSRIKGIAGLKKIAQDLEAGGKQKLSQMQIRLFRRSGWGRAAKKGYITRSARTVISPVFNQSSSDMKRIFKDTITRAFNG